MSGERNSFDNFEELYTNCYWLVYRYVRHMVEKDLAAAEDVTQEVFLVAYQKWQEVRRHPNQKGFLLLTAKNKLKKWYEQQGKIQTEGSGQEEKAAEGRIPVRKDIMYRQNGTPFWSRFFPCRSF